MKLLVKDIIDNFGLDVDGLFQNDEISIKLSDLRNFNEITIGKIIATNFNFQNIREINFVMSNLLQLDFLNTVKEVIESDYTPTSEYSKQAKTLRDNWESFLNIFELRNKIVHSLKVDMIVISTSLEILMDCAVCFLMTSGLITTERLLFQHGKADEKIRKILYKKIEDFKKIKNTK